MPDEQEWDTAEKSEAAVDKTPGERNAPYRASDEGKRDDSNASDQPEGDHPLVADRVDVGTEKCDSDHQMSECEPVCPLCKKWITRICSVESTVDAINPG